MPRRLVANAVSLALLVSVSAPIAPVGAAEACDPFLTTPVYDARVRTATQVLGADFAFGVREMAISEKGVVPEVNEFNEYLETLDADTDRVVTAEAATSVDGKSIRYAIVGREDRMDTDSLTAIRANLQVLRNPSSSGPALQAALDDTPAVLWVAGNVHGGEESGADAAMHALYELAARTDCVVEGILEDAIVVILPTQNPDGRAIGQRRNLYGFDMNRDWFARTQPETDGKLDVVRLYPPMLFLDVHEFGLADYFFPPNADPIYHEIPEVANDWINGLYSPAIVDQFQAEGIKFFHGAPYDFFAVVFGDTVPATGHHAAGMTLEKESGDPIAVREHEHFSATWASIAAGAAARDAVVAAWRASFVEAYEQGLAGTLEPNGVFEPKHKLLQPVPDVTVRGYFLKNDPDKAYELDLLVRRLQRMDVTVYQLTADLHLDAFHRYGDPSAATDLPAGTYWIPLAQGQKHWIQAMLNEETWIPFDVTFDVTAWSNPLLMDLEGGWSGESVEPAAAVVPPVGQPAWDGVGGTPSVGLFEIPISTRGFEAAFQTKYLFTEVWHLPFTDVTADQIVAGRLNDPGNPIDVLVMPDGFANYGLQALGAKGKRALRDWVNAGGTIVAWQGGAVVAAKAGASSAKFGGSHTNAPGTLIRVAVDASSPLAANVGNQAWVMYQDDMTLKPGLGEAVATFPASGDPDYGTSGLAINVDTLAGTTAVVDEAVGAGRVVSFSVDPNFRAWSQGTQRILWNAIVGSEPVGFGHAAPAGSKARAAAEKEAVAAADRLPQLGSAIRIRVAGADAAATAKILARHRAEVIRVDVDGDALFLVANRDDLSFEEHPFFGLIVRDLHKAGITPRAASLP